MPAKKYVVELTDEVSYLSLTGAGYTGPQYVVASTAQAAIMEAAKEVVLHLSQCSGFP